MAQRYKVTPPDQKGYAWWNVLDTKNPEGQFNVDQEIVATFSIHLPNAEVEARALCRVLNEVWAEWGMAPVAASSKTEGAD